METQKNCDSENEDQISKNIRKSVENICKAEGYVTYNVDTKMLSSVAGHFLGRLYVADIKGKTEEGNKENHLFIKHIIPLGKAVTIIDLDKGYETEAFVYNELFKVIDELQDEAKVPKEERFKTVRSYLGSDSEKLILENMDLRGYKSCDRLYTMTLDVAERTLAELAKWHAFSFVIEAKRPEFYKKLAAIRSAYTYNEEWEASVLNIAKIAIRYLTGEAKRRVEEYMPKFVKEWKRYMLDLDSKCCLCHGDVRLNNLLMKETNNKLTDLILIDYQLICYGNPINDFFYFIFTGTDQKFRRNHLVHLKNFYYENLKEFLKKFGLNSDDVYPKKEFELDYDDRFNYGLICSLYYMTFFLAGEGEVPDLETIAISKMDFGVHESFPDRIQGVVEDCIEWGYL